jgi:hypothetical protein
MTMYYKVYVDGVEEDQHPPERASGLIDGNWASIDGEPGTTRHVAYVEMDKFGRFRDAATGDGLIVEVEGGDTYREPRDTAEPLVEEEAPPAESSGSISSGSPSD